MKPLPFRRCQLALPRCLAPFVFASFSAVALAADLIKPTLVISAPARNARTTNETITVRGTARDNSGVRRVEFRVQNAAGTNAYAVAVGTTNWTGSATLAPGLNTIRARAVDVNTNFSAEVTTTVNYDVYKPIYLIVEPGGKVTGATNGQPLLVAKKYTLTALPSAGFVFRGWTNTTGLPTSIKTSFAFTNPVAGITVGALFSPATYSGLFMPKTNNHVWVTNSGSFTVTRTAAGTLSGKVMMFGKTYSFSGKQLGADGSANFQVVRAGLPPLQIAFQINYGSEFSPGNRLFGAVTDGAFTSELNAFSYMTGNDSWTGFYTAASGTPESGVDTPGYGTMTLRITRERVALTGVLPDNATFTTSGTLAPESGNMTVLPLYIPLQAGKGMFVAYVVIERRTAEGQLPRYWIFSGQSAWMKAPVATEKFYKEGFASQVEFYGSRYQVPALNQTPMGATNAMAIFEFGNLPAFGSVHAFDKPAAIYRTKATLQDAPGDTNAPPAATLNARININPTTGAVTGDFKHPGTKQVSRITGIILTDKPYGVPAGIYGLFQGTNRIGRVRLLFD